MTNESHDKTACFGCYASLMLIKVRIKNQKIESRMAKMLDRNEKKSTIMHRLIDSLIKPPPKKHHEKVQPKKESSHKFKYQLPSSFFEAVNKARVKAGYDVLPRFHNLSASSPHSTRHRKTHKHHHETTAKKKSQTPGPSRKHSHHPSRRSIA